jgi:hypothetical protein
VGVNVIKPERSIPPADRNGVRSAGDTANLDELKDDLGKTRVSEGVGQAILRGETAPHLQAPAPRKPAHRQMKDELAIANFALNPG